MQLPVMMPIVCIAAFLVLVLLGRRAREWAHLVAVPAAGVAFAVALATAARVWSGEVIHGSIDWMTVGSLTLSMGILVDPLAAVMLLVVTVVALLVMVYSIGYMHDEERYQWYFAVLCLFTAAMLTCVLADNYLLMFMGWEGVGLCSYLLIGYWHEDREPREASLKAFITTRVGDVGFALALAAILGLAGTATFEGVFESAEHWAPAAATLVALLLFAGAAGKSAQFPLHVWLPDAMAGPTPVSALIHAATMVAAGVYLVARSAPIFERSAPALVAVLVIGAFTAFGAGITAVVMYDIKKILAYSTISQLGFMMMALGAGAPVAAMFHLTTHAFFKALLFLGSGSVIHATHTQDIRKMGGLARVMPWTSWTFVLGSLALAGIPPLAGFFSKDEILVSISHAHTPAVIAGLHVHDLVLAVAIVTAGLTAFYMSRLCFRVFWGEPAHAHESPPVMTVPLVLLAALSAGAGFAAKPFGHFLAPDEKHHAAGALLIWGPVALAVGAILVGYLIYSARRVSVAPLRERAWMLYEVVENRFYMDDFYLFVLGGFLALCDRLARFDLGVIDWVVNASARVTVWASDVQRRFDEGVVDRLVELPARVAVAGGRVFRYVQTGSLVAYVQLMAAALVVLMVWFVLKGV